MKTVKYILASLSICLLLSCADDGPPADPQFPPLGQSPSDSSGFSIDGALNGANQALSRLTSSELSTKSSAEIEKLFQFEYFVEDIPLDLTAEEMNVRMTDLGKERWDCFNLEHVSKGFIRVFCKRRPTSYLQYMKMF